MTKFSCEVTEKQKTQGCGDESVLFLALSSQHIALFMSSSLFHHVPFTTARDENVSPNKDNTGFSLWEIANVQGVNMHKYSRNTLPETNDMPH